MPVVTGEEIGKASKADQSRKWARSVYAKMSPQTQADVDAIVAEFTKSETAAVAKFREMIRLRDWKLWEMSAVKDIALAMAGHGHDYGRAQS